MARAKKSGKGETEAQVESPRPVSPLPISIGSWMPISSLIPWDKNPRHNEKAIPRVADSIVRFGFISPIVIWTSQGRIVAGHTRLAGLQLLLSKDASFCPKGAPASRLAPVRFHEFESESEADLYAIADNKLNELAGWSEEKIVELRETHSWKREELSIAGVEKFEALEEDRDSGEDSIPEAPKVAVTKPGDIWQLGAHRLICGDSTSIDVLARLCGDAKADLLWTDPPYNVAYEGSNGKTIQNDEMSDEDFRRFLVSAFTAASEQMKSGAAFYIAHADVEMFNFAGAVRDVGWKFCQCIIWLKDQFVFGRKDYHSKHEPILYGWKEGAAHHALADRTQDTIWEFPRPRENKEHPTMKPVELIERAITNSTDRGANVLDCFGGSGSTLIAALKQERRSFLCELDPKYCDVIVERYQRVSGGKAKLMGA